MFVFIVLHFVSICCLALDKCNNHRRPKGGLVHILDGTMAVGRQEMITIGSSHQVLVMGSWAPKAKALAMHSQMKPTGLKSRKRTQLQSHVSNTQVHSLRRCWQLVDCILQVSGCLVNHGKYFWTIFPTCVPQVHSTSFTFHGLAPLQQLFLQLTQTYHSRTCGKTLRRLVSTFRLETLPKGGILGLKLQAWSVLKGPEKINHYCKSNLQFCISSLILQLQSFVFLFVLS